MQTVKNKIKTIEIDFYPRQSISLAAALIWAFALLSLGIGGYQWIENQRKLQTLDERINTVEREQTNKMASLAQSALQVNEQAQLVQWIEVQQSLNQPWFALFKQLESTLSTDIAVLQFKPNLKEKQLELLIEAKNLQAVVDWLERVRLTESYRNPRLVSQKMLVQEVGQPIQVQVNLGLFLERMTGDGGVS